MHTIDDHTSCCVHGLTTRESQPWLQAGSRRRSSPRRRRNNGDLSAPSARARGECACSPRAAHAAAQSSGIAKASRALVPAIARCPARPPAASRLGHPWPRRTRSLTHSSPPRLQPASALPDRHRRVGGSARRLWARGAHRGGRAAGQPRRGTRGGRRRRRARRRHARCPLARAAWPQPGARAQSRRRRS